MGVNLNCDECGKFVKTMKPQDIAKMRNEEEIVCDDCLKKIEAWHKKIDSAGNDEINRIKQEVQRARARFDKVVNDRQIQDGRS